MFLIFILLWLVSCAISYFVLPYSWRFLVSIVTGNMGNPLLGFKRTIIPAVPFSFLMACLIMIFVFSDNSDSGAAIGACFFLVLVIYVYFSYLYVRPAYTSYSDEQMKLIENLGKPEAYFVLDLKPKENLIILPNHVVIFDKVFDKKNLVGINSNIWYEYIESAKKGWLNGNVKLTFSDMEVDIDGENAWNVCGTDLTLMVSMLENIVYENNGTVVNRQTTLAAEKKEEERIHQEELKTSRSKFKQI